MHNKKQIFSNKQETRKDLKKYTKLIKSYFDFRVLLIFVLN